jgi:orotidine-5'-phosphate decarboxylase
MNEKIFVACDTTSTTKAKEIIRKTQTSKLKIGYKFGLEFLNSKNGRNFIKKIKNQTIFIDTKLHDIPNTCASAVKALNDLNINYLTMHISSGLEALKATKKVAGKIKLIGVTILTSLDNKALKEKAKLGALVCSAQEVKIVKKVFKKEIITPGIRFNTGSNDQKRTLSPKQAFKNGSNWLVIGRPITKGNVKRNIQNLIDHLEK